LCLNNGEFKVNLTVSNQTSYQLNFSGSMFSSESECMNLYGEYYSIFMIDDTDSFHQLHYMEPEVVVEKRNSKRPDEDIEKKYKERCEKQFNEAMKFNDARLNSMDAECENGANFMMSVYSTCKGLGNQVVSSSDIQYKNNQSDCNQDLNLTGFKEEQEHLRKYKDQFSPTDIQIEVKMKKPAFNISVKNGFLSFRLIMLRVKEDLRASLRSIKNSIKIFKILANFSFMFVFINSYKYFSSYLKKFNFDNFCITQYFRHIDARRYRAQKRTLLPLKKSEMTKLSYPFQFFVAAYQKAFVKFNIATHVFLIILIILSLLIDFLLDDFLTILQKNALIIYNIKTISDITYQVCGTGLLAQMIREMKKASAEPQFTKSNQFSNEKCLVKPGSLTKEQIQTLLVQFVLLNVCILFELYAKRLNKYICTLFFRKWEKKRIIWLYNDLLKRRKSFIENCKIKINSKKKSNRLVDSQPTGRIDRFIQALMRSRHEFCALCETKATDAFMKCTECNIIYCIECWLDLEEKCVGCVPDYFLYEDNVT